SIASGSISVDGRRRALMSTTTEGVDQPRVMEEMSFLDRWLPVWILTAMAAGLLLGRFIPGLNTALEAVKIGSVSLPIAIGLLVMMYPVLAKVRYDETRRIGADKRLMISSLVLNWLIGPALMFALAWIFLADLPEYRTGLIIVGLARCIAMVLIWNDLACGDREAAAVLVAINSVFQVIAFGALGWFYLQALPSWLGLPTTSAEFSIGAIVLSVLIFLGVPLIAGFLTRVLGERAKGRAWYEERFLPTIGPWALYGLLFTIVLLFALQGDAILSAPGDVARIAVPLLIYFVGMFLGAFLLGRAIGLNYAKSTTVAFTASGNNFELAIAVAIGTFGVTSGQALAGVVGPLSEVPVLVALVYVAIVMGRRLFPGDTTVPPDDAAGGTPHDDHRPTCSPVRVREERRQVPDGRCPHAPSGRRRRRGPLGRHRPRQRHNARSAEAVAEVGADIASAVPQPVTPELPRRVDQAIVIGGDAVIDPVEDMRAPVTTWRTRSVLRSPSRCAGTRVSPLSPAPASTRPAPHIARRHRSSSGSRPPTDVARTCAPLRSASPTLRQ